LVEGCVVVQIEAGEVVRALPEAQLLSYLKLGGWKLRLLINFIVPVLKNGICRGIL
jgi:GxxExxY protein